MHVAPERTGEAFVKRDDGHMRARLLHQLLDVGAMLANQERHALPCINRYNGASSRHLAWDQDPGGHARARPVATKQLWHRHIQLPAASHRRKCKRHANSAADSTSSSTPFNASASAGPSPCNIEPGQHNLPHVRSGQAFSRWGRPGMVRCTDLERCCWRTQSSGARRRRAAGRGRAARAGRSSPAAARPGSRQQKEHFGRRSCLLVRREGLRWPMPLVIPATCRPRRRCNATHRKRVRLAVSTRPATSLPFTASTIACEPHRCERTWRKTDLRLLQRHVGGIEGDGRDDGVRDDLGVAQAHLGWFDAGGQQCQHVSLFERLGQIGDCKSGLRA